MNTVFGLTCFPLILAASLAVLWHFHWAENSTNQIKVDALSLSLCHQKAQNFNHELKLSNQSLDALSITMNLVGAECMAEAAALIVRPEFLAKIQECRNRIKVFAQPAKLIELSQVAYLSGYIPSAQLARAARVTTKNDLEPLELQPLHGPKFYQASSLQQPHPQVEGFVREELGSFSKFLENFYAGFGSRIHWPRNLIADRSPVNSSYLGVSEQFEKTHLVSFRYQPQIHAPYTHASLAPLRGQAEHQSTSSCSLRELKAGEKYKVFRTKKR